MEGPGHYGKEVGYRKHSSQKRSENPDSLNTKACLIQQKKMTDALSPEGWSACCLACDLCYYSVEPAFLDHPYPGHCLDLFPELSLSEWSPCV